MQRPSEELVIRPAVRHRQPQVLWLLYQGEPPGSRLAAVEAALRATAENPKPRGHLLEACRGRALVGATWGQVAPGRTALLSPPRLVDGEGETTADALLDTLDQRLQSQSVRVVQASLTSLGSSDSARLVRHGYNHAADLSYLVSTPCAFPRLEPISSLCFERYRESDRDRLCRLIEATYEQTLDIPALDQVREMDDILAGYQDVVPPDAHCWFFVTHQGRDVGCLLLNDHRRDRQFELVYMGLIREARGNGWGLNVVRFAQWMARITDRQRLILAVDAANGPAIAGYDKAGFVEWERRHIFLRVYPPKTESRHGTRPGVLPLN